MGGETAESGDEDALLALAREGDEGVFWTLVEAHRVRLHARCCLMPGSYHDAEDAVQETLPRAWVPAFQGRGTVRSGCTRSLPMLPWMPPGTGTGRSFPAAAA